MEPLASRSAAISTVAKAPPKPEKDAKLEAAAQAFEAVLLRQMIGSMRQASLGEDVLGSSASEQFRDMSDARLADEMAGGFGIARLLVQQLGKAGKKE